MARYLTESDLRAGELGDIVEAVRWINSAFLLDIKQDHVEFRELLQQMQEDLQPGMGITPKYLAESLGRLRDELETYFSLEEFYGCYEHASGGDSRISRLVNQLKDEHESLFLQLQELVEAAEQVLYQEAPEVRIGEIIERFAEFCQKLEQHEATELDLISRQSVLDIGVGD